MPLQSQPLPSRQKTSAKPAGATLGGISAEAVRRYLLQAAELGSWTIGDLQKILGLDAVTARVVVAALSIVGYSEPDAKDPKRRSNTEAGSAMASVSWAKPITRKTAEKALAAFEERVREVDMKSRFQFRVEKAVVFGPYLTGAEKLKNVDDAIALRAKAKDRHELDARVKADADGAATAPKRFKSFADRRAWRRDQGARAPEAADVDRCAVRVSDAILAQPHWGGEG
jgi:hypothetical protein